MARTRTPGRLAAIVDAAITEFGANGFDRTQISDVARRARLSVGSVYKHVSGKETLLLLAVEQAFGAELDDRDLPVETPDPALLVESVRAKLAESARLPSLDAALRRRAAPRDPAAELSEILGELYDLIGSTRRAADAIERCSRDRPELAVIFYGDVRGHLHSQLSRYLGARRTRTSASPEMAATYVIETVTWFARHRYHDPDGSRLDAARARAAAIDLIVAAVYHVNASGQTR